MEFQLIIGKELLVPGKTLSKIQKLFEALILAQTRIGNENTHMYLDNGAIPKEHTLDEPFVG